MKKAYWKSHLFVFFLAATLSAGFWVAFQPLPAQAAGQHICVSPSACDCPDGLVCGMPYILSYGNCCQVLPPAECVSYCTYVPPCLKLCI